MALGVEMWPQLTMGAAVPAAPAVTKITTYTIQDHHLEAQEGGRDPAGVRCVHTRKHTNIVLC